MARWARAAYLGPPDANWGGVRGRIKGFVEHIAEGSYSGTIGWMQNPVSDVSSHFVIDYDGTVAQMLDTDFVAWTEAAGNPYWVSAEFAGFNTGSYTPAQQEAASQLYAWLHQVHGVPLQLTDDVNIDGWGWHGMGGVAWGNHPNCPGVTNVALRASMLQRTIQILGGSPEGSEGMSYTVRSGAEDGSIYLVPGGLAPSGLIACFAIYGTEYNVLPAVQLPPGVTVTGAGLYDVNPRSWPSGGSGGGPTLTEITAAVRSELDRTKIPGVTLGH